MIMRKFFSPNKCSGINPSGSISPSPYFFHKAYRITACSWTYKSSILAYNLKTSSPKLSNSISSLQTSPISAYSILLKNKTVISFCYWYCYTYADVVLQHLRPKQISDNIFQFYFQQLYAIDPTPIVKFLYQTTEKPLYSRGPVHLCNKSNLPNIRQWKRTNRT